MNEKQRYNEYRARVTEESAAAIREVRDLVHDQTVRELEDAVNLADDAVHWITQRSVERGIRSSVSILVLKVLCERRLK